MLRTSLGYLETQTLYAVFHHSTNLANGSLEIFIRKTGIIRANSKVATAASRI